MAGASAPIPESPSSMDEVIEAYKRDVDRTLLRENLRKTPDQRVRDMVAALRAIEALRESASTSSR